MNDCSDTLNVCLLVSEKRARFDPMWGGVSACTEYTTNETKEEYSRGNAMYVTTKHITSMSVMFCAVQVNAHFFINWYSLEWYIIFHKQTKEKEEPF
jgi:hypothetical protein